MFKNLHIRYVRKKLERKETEKNLSSPTLSHLFSMNKVLLAGEKDRAASYFPTIFFPFQFFTGLIGGGDPLAGRGMRW